MTGTFTVEKAKQLLNSRAVHGTDKLAVMRISKKPESSWTPDEIATLNRIADKLEKQNAESDPAGVLRGGDDY